MLTIDGSHGEGGGQILRTALSLSLVTGQPCTVERIRSRRPNPGLRRQHLTAVAAAAAIGSAQTEGASLGSQTLVFVPGEVRPGGYEFDVGTAGSTTLVLQTLLPPLMAADGASSLVITGGTHNPMAPPFDFLERAFLPLVERLGPQIRATLDRPGFAPAGGGRIRVVINPAAKLGGLSLLDRGGHLRTLVQITLADLPGHIAEREWKTIAQSTGWKKSCLTIEEIAGAGPGNVVNIVVESAHVTEVFTGFGAPRVRAEQVARLALAPALAYLESDVPVAEHLADQLLVPLALAAYRDGSRSAFRTCALSPHAETNIEIVRKFLAVSIATTREREDRVRVDVGPLADSGTRPAC